MKCILKENRDLKAHIEVIKNTLAKTIELKNSEVDNLQKHNGHRINKIVELKAQISKISLNKKEDSNSEHLKHNDKTQNSTN